ncbi:MAG: hypothetical protein IKN50_01405 [Clostridia bacterium]|nr:hypothetical protein [Clostridia bacterium]
MSGAAPRGLSANVLKIIAAVSMTVDHVGVLLFPKIYVLRIIGRLAMPIFAWFIAEGMIRTRSPIRYFLRVFTLAVVCQIPYILVEREFYLGILFTFSCSIGIMAIVRGLLYPPEKESARDTRALYAFGLAAAVAFAYFLCEYVKIDYGFFGILLPVSAYLFRGKGARMASFTVCLLALAVAAVAGEHPSSLSDVPRLVMTCEPEPFALLAVPLIALYSGYRGKLRMKYFFYIFYPAHMLIVYAVSLILK